MKRTTVVLATASLLCAYPSASPSEAAIGTEAPMENTFENPAKDLYLSDIETSSESISLVCPQPALGAAALDCEVEITGIDEQLSADNEPALELVGSSMINSPSDNDTGLSSARRIQSPLNPEIDGPGLKQYLYAPDVVQVDSREETFYCGNSVLNSGSVVDSIMRSSGGVKYEVLRSTPGNWDSEHMCDPDVVRGDFEYNGKDYDWAMFYTGTQDPNQNGTQNQVGLAFSDDLERWTKYPDPVVTYSGQGWGVGQPSAISMDADNGEVLLMYTSSDPKNDTYGAWIDLSDISDGTAGISEPWKISADGLKPYDGTGTPTIKGADFVYDDDSNEFTVVRPSSFNNENPDFISTELEVASIDRDSFLAGSGSWSSLGRIGTAQTGSDKNFDAGITHDQYGFVENGANLTINYSKAPSVPDNQAPYWGYRIGEFTVPR